MDYKIYPSLLDSFAWYKKSESEDAKKEFIDKINRVKFQSDAADKGTAFNLVVDCCLKNEFESIILSRDKYNNALVKHSQYPNFEFSHEIVQRFVNHLEGSIPQLYVEGTIEVNGKQVLLYGFLDELKFDLTVDIKTTSSYTFPKYLHNWQHIVYPYCLNQMGVQCTAFRYLVTDFSNVYKEDYAYDESKVLNRLKNEIADLIHFIEVNRETITDTKIFGGEKPVQA